MLLWSKGFILTHRKTELVMCDQGDELVGLFDLTMYFE